MGSALDKASLLSGANAVFLAEIYARWLEDPKSVDTSWAELFSEMGDDLGAALTDVKGPSWTKVKARVVGQVDPEEEAAAKAKAARNGKAGPAVPAPAGDPGTADTYVRQHTIDSIRAIMLIRAYRIRGHMLATLDPLGLQTFAHHPELDPASYGFSDADMDRAIFIDGVLGFETATLREIIAKLHRTYCAHVGVEYMHIQDPDQKQWIQYHMENAELAPPLSRDEKLRIFDNTTRSELFEKYLNTKFKGTKRFGVDGGEALIPLMEEVLHTAAKAGVQEVVLGMAHRGRLNVLANVMSKPLRKMFAEFQGVSSNPEDLGSGDVKYHLGTSADRDFDGNAVHLSLNANPSHLEAVDPVIIGRVRAKEDQLGDLEPRGNKVLPILLHGDAAFAGQGLVPETLDMSELKGYKVGGSIHIIINNQIGFTTKPTDARSGPYATEVAKTIQAPIFHVNGDDPEACARVARMATEFRQTFKKIVVIDMWCYRRHGHNEADEPAFTQPTMYRVIKDHPSVWTLYSQKLVAEGVLSQDEVDARANAFHSKLEEEFEAAQAYKPNKADWLEGAWRGFEQASGDDRRGDTQCDMDLLKKVGATITTVPDSFNLNPKIARQLKAKQDMMSSGEGFDWATGEALAFGTLCAQGYRVRLSGQDCGRGTFSQRHAALYDQENEEKYVPLQHVAPDQGKFEVLDSPLAEASVVGFEYGYSVTDPNALVLWEGQFGDFSNGAQIIIDQFISSGEAKWLRMSGLVMLLPHGYEGQGPEHSSARMERYLQMCGEDNWQVCNITTPANYYHALRRQMRRQFRKPLIIFTPKSLLRHKRAVSKLEEFGPGTSFHRVLPETYDDQLVADKDIRRVVMCSGKVYYDLLEEREKRGTKDVAIIRLEQFYPWPRTSVGNQLKRYPNAQVLWCQEEPANMGGWSFVRWHIEDVLEEIGHKFRRPLYSGRSIAAAPATGLAKRHAAEQAALVDKALTVTE
ncbi:2-oxoglutarate dehydrogenase E1 component [Radicibacter daui]|uniref:2-oxoglutarate dehydrogenase E1 component n=1 Tax=Radicibacter daui TaxID=3064829 RepID=UPI0040470027